MLTSNTQPAILTTSVAAAAACAERGLRPALAAGHSLGEYSALVVAGALRLADAVRVVRKRGQFMQEAVPVGTGAMAAMMGLPLDSVEAVCREAAQGEVVEVANVNSAGQIVVAGHGPAVERAVALAAGQGGRVKSVMLPVSAPFHCALMGPAAERTGPRPGSGGGGGARLPVVRNVDGGVTRSADDVKPFLLRQVASPVRWTDCVPRLAARAPPLRGGRPRARPVGSGQAHRRRRGGSRRGGSAGLDKALAAGRRAVSLPEGAVAIVTGGTRGIGLTAACSSSTERPW